MTRDNHVLTLTMCVNHGGRAELADAARAIGREVAAGRLDPEKITEKTLARHLYLPDLADADMVWHRRAAAVQLHALAGRLRRDGLHRRALGPTPTGRAPGRPSRPTPPVTAGTAARCPTPDTPRRAAEESGAPDVDDADLLPTGASRVYVDMVGDLFHAGHVAFLREARRHGDRLVVGVLSDGTLHSYDAR